MPPVLNSIAPATGSAGTQLILTGSGFAAGAVVLFRSEAAEAQDPITVFDSGTQLRAVVPEFEGSVDLRVLVMNPGELPSSERPFTYTSAPAAPVAQPLTSVSRVKALLGLGIDERAHETKLAACIDLASEQIRAFCGTTFGVEQFTEVYDGKDLTVLTLRQAPIVELLGLKFSGVAVSVSEVKVYRDYLQFPEAYDDSSPRVLGGRLLFPRGLQNIEVTYKAGYATVPGDLAGAAAEHAIHLFNTVSTAGIVSESNQESRASRSYDGENMFAPRVKSVLLRYRRTRVMAI